MRVTREDLVKLEACDYDRDCFYKEWPNGVEVTEESLKRAFEIGLDVSWWARKLFGKSYTEAERPLWKAYQAAEEPLWKAYQAARWPLWEAYQAANRPLRETSEADEELWNAYKASEGLAWNAYEAANKPLQEAYQAAMEPVWDDFSNGMIRLILQLINTKET